MATPITGFRLVNGSTLPAIGLGTFQGNDGNEKVKNIVKAAIQAGYRHIDGASAYDNEKAIGEAIKESSISRDELFITTKLAQSWHEPKDVERALDLSLKALGLEYATNITMVILSWAVQRGTSIIPKTSNESRLSENLSIAPLSEEHFAIIDGLAITIESGPVRYLDPSKHLGFDIFHEELDQPVDNQAPWD
ncbi:hypothetical protein BTUL_0237g00040 [Botrytis tulipae]|uniref:NADP-dependent oxidoreductase domain-containing protein n=1 Tax=Botrytis tulipae TaxID=87230 RepID=A0A4Z1EBG5_9HELO|nr:hypothetical protein BTUL_0237g00040 [Botrytis tulipae]